MQRPALNRGNQIMTDTSLAVPPALAASVTEQPKPRTHVPPLDHAKKALALQNEWATRVGGNAFATAQLFAQGIDPETWAELLQLGEAARQRFSALQNGWLQDWTAWVRYSDQIKGANTMSKLAERESNIGVQWASILGAQAATLIAWEENIEVAYSYWVSEKLERKKRIFFL